VVTIELFEWQCTMLGVLALFQLRGEFAFEGPALVKSFEFKSGGNFTIRTSLNENGGTVFAAESADIITGQLQDIADLCVPNVADDFDHARLIAVQNSTGFFNGTIDRDGLFQAFFGLCSEFESSRFNVTVEFLNPATHLSWAEYPLVTAAPAQAAVLTLVILICIINWLCFCTCKNQLHLLFTFAFSFAWLSSVFSSLEIQRRDVTDDDSVFYQFCAVFRYFQAGFMLWVGTFCTRR
jgi:hypothetical protein